MSSPALILALCEPGEGEPGHSIPYATEAGHPFFPAPSGPSEGHRHRCVTCVCDRFVVLFAHSTRSLAAIREDA